MKKEYLETLLAEAKYWEMSVRDLSFMVGCSPQFVNRVKSSIKRPLESPIEECGRKLDELIGTYGKRTVFMALVSTGALSNALSYLGEEIVQELLEKSRRENGGSQTQNEFGDSCTHTEGEG